MVYVDEASSYLTVPCLEVELTHFAFGAVVADADGSRPRVAFVPIHFDTLDSPFVIVRLASINLSDSGRTVRIYWRGKRRRRNLSQAVAGLGELRWCAGVKRCEYRWLDAIYSTVKSARRAATTFSKPVSFLPGASSLFAAAKPSFFSTDCLNRFGL